MDYYQLKSILLSSKQIFHLSTPSESFVMAGQSTRPYIEPTFEKVFFEKEKPSVILVSAIGATGKTALALQVSRETGLPILDLSKHKPVGANTLIGLLTSAFGLKDIGAVLQALSDGTYGIIIDGIDEGRSKTTAKAFEAFLDDIVKLCKISTITTFMLLGRTQVVDECWEYLTNQSIEPALITIEPFDMDGAKRYIDVFTDGPRSPFASQYATARDFIINKLSKAFLVNPTNKDEQFLSFIGYPPVLDAIVTLLKEERNFHRLLEDLKTDEGGPVEISLLRRITVYILDRERKQKVLQNIITPLVCEAPESIRYQAHSNAYLPEEQSARLVAHCLGQSLKLSVITEPLLNDKYEEQLGGWVKEHPFIKGGDFQNAVFEAVAVAYLMASQTPSFHAMAKEYLSKHKSSYHLLYMLDSILEDHNIRLEYVNEILLSAMEFRSLRSGVELHLSGAEAEDDPDIAPEAIDVDIDIEILVGDDPEPVKSFVFHTETPPGSCLSLGPRLASTFITVPCDVYLKGEQEIELTSPVEISARSIQIDSQALIVRPAAKREGSSEVILNARKIGGSVGSVSPSGVSFYLMVDDKAGTFYPLIQYVHEKPGVPNDPLVKKKYLRLRRILLEFRSHSRGSLAKFKVKIEAERVLRNEMGWAILRKLITDGILTLKGSHYHLDSQSMSEKIGITYQDLRKGLIPESLIRYLQLVNYHS